MTDEQKDPKPQATRDGFGTALLELGKNPQVVALSANLCESTRVLPFADQYPDRYFEMGVAEQNMAGVAAGLALAGKIPFLTSFGAFSPGTNWAQIRTAICYNNLNIKIVATHCGLTVGPDGATHQALEDIALMRVLPNMVVLSPADSLEAKNATLAAAAYPGPVYLRLGRQPLPQITTDQPFKIGPITTLKSGRDLTIFATGYMVYIALQAAEILAKQKIDAAVINCPTIKPLDSQAVIAAAKSSPAILTVEEHQITGALGSAVAEVLAENQLNIPFKRLGVNDSFGESGDPADLLQKYHLDPPALAKAAQSMLK